MHDKLPCHLRYQLNYLINQLALKVNSQVVNTKAVVTKYQSLVGREIYHKWKDKDGEDRWCKGKVLSLVPGTTEWYNVKYDGEDDIRITT